jgi:hypothetical protein
LRNAENCLPWHFSARLGAVHAGAGESCPGREAPNKSALPYGSDQPGSYRVTSQVLVFRLRATQSQPYFFSGRRQDLLREGEGGVLRLAARDIVMDEAVLQSPNLSFLV